MRQIFWVLLIGPPVLGVLTWLLTRGWISMMMGARSTPRILFWRKYDLWIILGIICIAMFTAAFVEHKL